MQLLVHILLGLAELSDRLAKPLGKLWKLLRPEHDENYHKDDDHVRAGEVGEKRKSVHKSRTLA